MLRFSAPVISTDFYPTLLEMAGLPVKPEQHLDGVSLVPLLKGNSELQRTALYWHYPHYSNQGGFPGGAIRIGDYKLLERFEDGRVHLYNLKDDIGERNDLAEQMPPRVGEMRERLHKWYQDVDAKFLRRKERRARAVVAVNVSTQARVEPLTPYSEKCASKIGRLQAIFYSTSKN